MSRWIFIAMSAPLSAVALYVFAAIVLGLVAVNPAPAPKPSGIDVFIQTNGVHADLIVPIVAAGIDWRASLPLDTIAATVSPTGYLSIGWEDRPI